MAILGHSRLRGLESVERQYNASTMCIVRYKVLTLTVTITVLYPYSNTLFCRTVSSRAALRQHRLW